MTIKAIVPITISLLIFGCGGGLVINGPARTVISPAPADAAYLDMNRLATVCVERDDGGHGTGFFVSLQGHIVTARHVVHGAKSVTVKAWNDQGRLMTPKAVVVAEDEANDLVLLKADIRPVQTVVLAVNGDAHVGDAVYAAGYLHSFGEVVSRGWLMAVDYDAPNSSFPRNMLITDANGGPGDSGAGLFLAGSGKLIGVWQIRVWVGKPPGPFTVIHLAVGVEPVRRLLEANHVPFATER